MTPILLHVTLTHLPLASASAADSVSRATELGTSGSGIHWVWLCLTLWFAVSLAMGGAWIVCDRLLSRSSASKRMRRAYLAPARPLLRFPAEHARSAYAPDHRSAPVRAVKA